LFFQWVGQIHRVACYCDFECSSTCYQQGQQENWQELGHAGQQSARAVAAKFDVGATAQVCIKRNNSLDEYGVFVSCSFSQHTRNSTTRAVVQQVQQARKLLQSHKQDIQLLVRKRGFYLEGWKFAACGPAQGPAFPVLLYVMFAVVRLLRTVV
jgi:hypothetical protein